MTPKYSIFKRDWGWKLTWLTSFVESGRLDHCIDLLLVVNALFIIFESSLDMRDIPEPGWVDYVEQGFSMIYVVEVIMKLMVYDFQTYWQSGGNRFDFIVTWVLFLAGSIAFMPGNPWIDPFVRYFNLIRIARLIRLLGRID